MEETVVVHKLKYPGRARTAWKAIVLERRLGGLWLLSPRGSYHRKPSGGTWDVERAGVQFLPDDRWWVAWFWDADEPWMAVDICTPPVDSPAGWWYQDLEIDVVGNAQGFREVVDVDEFVAARSRGIYAPEMEASVLHACGEVIVDLHAGAEWLRAGWELLERHTTTTADAERLDLDASVFADADTLQFIPYAQAPKP